VWVEFHRTGSAAIMPVPVVLTHKALTKVSC
jgi:hypothetical protein